MSCNKTRIFCKDHHIPRLPPSSPWPSAKSWHSSECVGSKCASIKISSKRAIFCLQSRSDGAQQVSRGEMNGVGARVGLMCMIGQGEVLPVILGPPDGTVVCVRACDRQCLIENTAADFLDAPHYLFVSWCFSQNKDSGQERRLRFFRSLTHHASSFSSLLIVNTVDRDWKGFLFLLADCVSQKENRSKKSWLWLTPSILPDKRYWFGCDKQQRKLMKIKAGGSHN